MTLSLIAAMAEDGCIGFQNKLPWHIPEDLKHFKELTLGHPVIMGRKTYDSMGRLLPGRLNIIITHQKDFKIDGAEICNSLKEATKTGEQSSPQVNEQFVIGGGEIFKQALQNADRLYLTIVHEKFKGDTYFPKLDLEKDFKITEKTRHRSSGSQGLEYTFITAERIKR